MKGKKNFKYALLKLKNKFSNEKTYETNVKKKKKIIRPFGISAKKNSCSLMQIDDENCY